MMVRVHWNQWIIGVMTDVAYISRNRLFVVLVGPLSFTWIRGKAKA